MSERPNPVDLISWLDRASSVNLRAKALNLSFFRIFCLTKSTPCFKFLTPRLPVLWLSSSKSLSISD